MSEMMIRPVTAAEFDNVRRFLFGSQQEALEKRGLVLAAYDGETLCGALGALPEEGVLRIVSLYIDEGSRRKGAASALLDTAELQAEQHGAAMLHAAYSCAPEQALGLSLLFTSRGFLPPEKGTTMYSIALDAVDNSRFGALAEPSPTLSARIFPLDEMPGRAWDGYRKRLENELPDYMDPARTVGIPLPELCLTYVEDDSVRGALVVTEAGGTLHLAGAHLDGRQYGSALIALLKTALNTAREKYPQFDTLTVTGATEIGRSLIERLFEGAPYTESVVYTSAKLLTYSTLPQPGGYSGVMVRTQTLAPVLAARGYECRVVSEDGTLPYLAVEIDGTDLSAEFFYTADDVETYSAFTLEAETVFPADGLSDAQREDICAQLNAGQTEDEAAFVLEEDGTHIVLRAVHEELSSFDEEAVLDGFVLPYLEQAGKCAMLISEKKEILDAK